MLSVTWESVSANTFTYLYIYSCHIRGNWGNSMISISRVSFCRANSLTQMSWSSQNVVPKERGAVAFSLPYAPQGTHPCEKGGAGLGRRPHSTQLLWQQIFGCLQLFPVGGIGLRELVFTWNLNHFMRNFPLVLSSWHPEVHIWARRRPSVQAFALPIEVVKDSVDELVTHQF